MLYFGAFGCLLVFVLNSRKMLKKFVEINESLEPQSFNFKIVTGTKGKISHFIDFLETNEQDDWSMFINLNKKITRS